ncbi:hypothetical protein [Mycolicibacterium sp.]|uniref:hypothetical protein n=1 Tax=Mycolicibacterium sp. TaxID=2320850 RepID=UPI003D12EA51
MSATLPPAFLGTNIAVCWLSDVTSAEGNQHARWTVLHDIADIGAGFAVSVSPPDGADHHVADLEGVPYRLRTFQQGPYVADSSPESEFVLAVALYVPDDTSRIDCRRWLDEEHARRQLEVAGTHWYAGYESAAGPFNFLNLWGLQKPEVIATEAWAAARDTPWRTRLLNEGIVHTRRALFGRASEGVASA